MKILFPADGSPFTKKALAFLITHEDFCGPQDELIVLHVQTPMPPRVKGMVGSSAVPASVASAVFQAFSTVSAYRVSETMPPFPSARCRSQNFPIGARARSRSTMRPS